MKVKSNNTCFKKLFHSRSLLIDSGSEEDTDAIMEFPNKIFAGMRVKIYPHHTMNNSKGFIDDPIFRGATEEEVVDNIDYAVAAYNIKIKRMNSDGSTKIITTDKWVITFDIPVRPTSIKIKRYMTRIKVEAYVPNPMRCFHCQGYGHTENKMQKERENML